MKNAITLQKNKTALNTSPLKKLFLSELKELFWVEKYLLKVFPKLEKAAGTRYLKACFKGHFLATKDHVSRLEISFNLLGEKPLSKKSQAVTNLILETNKIIISTEKNTLARDLGLLDAAQKLEEYEINKYCNLIMLSTTLNHYKISTLLEETLAEEREAEETFVAIKEDTLCDERYKPVSTITDEEFEAAEEE